MITAERLADVLPSLFQTRTILALRYPSYRHAGARNLVVFTDHLARLGGEVVLIDSSGTHVQSLP